MIPRSNQNSETNSTGYFVMTGVPAETTTLQMEWGGGLTVRVPIVTAEGGTYSVIPAIRRPVTTASVPIPTASWTRVQAAECVQPNVAFALEVSVPGDPSGRTQLQIDLLNGVRFARAFTRNSRGTAVDTDLERDVQRRWEFGNGSGLINPEIEICVSAPSGAIPQPASIRTQYWHVTMQ